tara:strand:- start:338 stop:508 length:171 start_codon:yes stop_codon:yes gene_type:complete
MSTLTKTMGLPDPDLSDKVIEVKTSFVLAQEAAAKAAEQEAAAKAAETAKKAKETE